MSPQGRIVVGVLAVVAVMAGFWFVLLAPKRTDISTVNDQIVQAQTRRDAALAAAAQADQARSTYQRDYAVVARLGKAVPADDDVASVLYQLESIARANRIDFRAVKLVGAAAASAPAPAPAPKAEDSESKDEDAKGEDADVADPVVPVVRQPPPGTVVGPAGLLTVPFTFTFDGSYMKMQRFLKAINRLAKTRKAQITVNGRLLTVDGFALSASKDGFPKVKAVVSATAYIVPEADDASAASTPQGPAGATTTSTAMLTPNAQGAGR